MFNWILNTPLIGKLVYMLGVSRLSVLGTLSHRLMHGDVLEA